MVNTEKPTTKQEAKKNVAAPKITNKNDLSKIPKQKTEVKKTDENKTTTEKPTDKKEVKKAPVKKVKKTQVAVNATGVPISTKYSKAICKFIKNKTIGKAITDLERVMAKKQAVPMKGEIPHRKGKGMMSGRFPVRASENFIVLLKGLLGNATNHEVEDPVIVEAIANIGKRPFGRFGAVRKKRSHVTIIARDKKLIKNKKTKKNKK